MYDSLGVRRTVQEHTKILQKITEKDSAGVSVKNTSTGRGHTPKEVMGGLVVGMIVGLVCAVVL